MRELKFDLTEFYDMGEYGRTPRGVRELKFLVYHQNANHKKSHSAWGA